MAMRRLEVYSEPPEISYEAFDPNDEGNIDHVERIIRWSVRESMVPINPDTIQKHQLAHVARVEDRLAGYGAVTHIYSGNVIELGGLVVGERFRGMGIASGLVETIVASAREELKPEMILAWSNPTSATLFSRLGGKQVADAQTLPAEVWKLCHTCRYYDEYVEEMGKICCGRVFDVTHVNEDT